MAVSQGNLFFSKWLRALWTLGLVSAWAAGDARAAEEGESKGAPVPPSAAIELDFRPTQKFYSPHTENTVWFCVQVRAAEAGSQSAGMGLARRNIAWVLDRSGSMEGERMAALQAAVAGAVQNLAPEDMVSVVVFGSEVETVVESQPSGAAAERLALAGRWESGGGAALFDGLSQGAAQLRRNASSDTVNQLILVTDGEATKGPRERGDFERLAEGLLREGITLTVVGLGDEFPEDLLVAMARAGGGDYRYCPTPDLLADVLAQATGPTGVLVASDVVISLEFRSYWDDVRLRGGVPGQVNRRTGTCRVPGLIAGQERVVVASGLLPVPPTGGLGRDSVRARVRWVDTATGETQEVVRSIVINFSSELRDYDFLLNPAVHRALAGVLLTEGLGEAIEALDRGDNRRFLRGLREARDGVRRLKLEGDVAAESPALDAFEAYLAEVQARGVGPGERKLLRSGLLSRLEPPAPETARARSSSYSSPSFPTKTLYP